jgi:hypothetical protein
VRLPSIDQYGLGVRQWDEIIAYGKLGVRTIGLYQHVTMRMRMTHERAVHVEQGDTAERAMNNSQRCRHCGLLHSENLKAFIALNASDTILP